MYFVLLGWLAGCFGFNGYFSQYFGIHHVSFFPLAEISNSVFFFFFFFFFGKFLQDRENSVGKYYRASILSRLPVQIMLLGCRLYGYISHALFKMVEKALGLYICDYQFSSMAYNTLRRRFM